MSTMPMTGNFIRESIELHLFWARIMKEHAIFVEDGFECMDAACIQEADALKCQFEEILHEAICLANGWVSADVLQSGELFTDNTLMAEQKTQELSGIAINSALTAEEMNLRPYMDAMEMSMGTALDMGQDAGMEMGSLVMEENLVQGAMGLEQTLCVLNDKALACAQSIYAFLERIYQDVVNRCCLYTHNYPSIFSHHMEETRMYMKLIQRVQNRQIVDPTFQMVEMEMLWNHLMKEHAEIIRQMLDPTEEAMIEKANMYAKEFKKLEKQFKDETQPRKNLREITRESIRATEGLKNFKAVATDLILACELKSVISSLLADHVLREAFYYLRILGMPLPEFKGGRG
jgi:hypothetical protein